MLPASHIVIASHFSNTDNGRDDRGGRQDVGAGVGGRGRRRGRGRRSGRGRWSESARGQKSPRGRQGNAVYSLGGALEKKASIVMCPFVILDVAQALGRALQLSFERLAVSQVKFLAQRLRRSNYRKTALSLKVQPAASKIAFMSPEQSAVGPLNTVPKKKCTTCRQKARASILPRKLLSLA